MFLSFVAEALNIPVIPNLSSLGLKGRLFFQFFDCIDLLEFWVSITRSVELLAIDSRIFFSSAIGYSLKMSLTEE